MHRSPSLFPSLLVLLPALLVARPSDPPPRQAPPESLLACMEAMKAELKGTAVALRAADPAIALEHVAELERFVLLAKLHDPANLAELPEADREAHRLAFRATLVGVLKELADLELDLLDGRTEDAAARIAGPLFRMRQEAHARFQSSK